MNDPLGLFDEEKQSGQEDPLGLFENTPKRKTTAFEDVKKSFGDVLNTLDIGVSMPASVLARAFQGQQAQEDVFKEMDERVKARQKKYTPDAEQSFGGKALGMIGTLPLQIAAMPFASAETGKTFIDQGESVGKAQAAVGLDAALNALGMALPGAAGGTRAARAVAGVGINAGQDTAARLALQQLADKEGTKEVFAPSLETAGLAGILGGGVGAMYKGKPKAGLSTAEERMKAAAAARKAEAEAAKTGEALPADAQGQLRLFDEISPEVDPRLKTPDVEVETAGKNKRQMDLFDTPPREGEGVLTSTEAGTVYKSTPEVEMWRDRAESISGKENLDLLRQENPDDFAGLFKSEAEPAIAKLEQEALAQKQQQADAMWEHRRPAIDEAVEQRSRAEDARKQVEDELLGTQQRLSSERVSKGQQRKMNRGMARGQRGALNFDFPFLDNRRKQVEALLGTELRAEAPKGVDVVSAALQEGKDGRGLSYVESGGSLAALKRGSAAVLGASRIVQDAVNRADLTIRQMVLPVETSLRRLEKPEMVELMNLFKEETALERKFTAAELAEFGYEPKVLAAYNDMRSMFTKALEKENAAREALGKDPITELEYYTSHRWQGNFRQDFLTPSVDKNGNVRYDKEGKVIMKHVWSLAGKTKLDLARQRKALLEQFPELKADKERVLRQGKDIASPSELYKHMLDVLGKDDPAVARIKKWYEKAGVEDPAAAMVAQEKHFKNRAGVRGYIGDRPANEPAGLFKRGEGRYNPEREAIDFFQEQITYAKNGLKWAEMQRAGQEIKTIVSDADLNAQQPNNVKYIRDYWKQNLGVSEAKWVNALEDLLHDLPKGLATSPNEVRKTLGDVKSAWIGQKLLASAGFVASNVVQATAVLPHMTDIMIKTGGNPLSGVAAGMMALMTMPTAHWGELANNAMLPGTNTGTKLKKAAMMTMPEWHSRALKYAEDNGVISRSTYDESPIDASFSKTRRAAEFVGKATIAVPETIVRSFAFMAFAEQLRSSGKYADDMEIFRLAEERTNIAMADYRPGERPILFNKAGMAGDLAGALQTFPVNFYNQWNWAIRESMKGNPAPAAVMALTQYAVAGFLGLPGFQDLDKLIEAVKDWAAENDPKLWNTLKDMNPKRLVMDHLGEAALYGKLSEASGLAMTSRVAAPSGTDMALAGGNVIADLGKQALNFVELARKPSQEQFAKTAIESAPVGLQGALETGPLRDMVSKPTEDGQLYSTRGDTKGAFTRTPQDEEIRKWGVRSQREAVMKDETWQRDSRVMQSKDATKSTFEAFYKAAIKEKPEEAASYMRLYIEIAGKEITSKQIENRVLQDYTDKIQRGQMSAKDNLAAITAIKRMQNIVGKYQSP